MNWGDKLELHLENLIPGLALVTVILTYYKAQLGVDLSEENSLFVSTGFLATSYLIGAVGNVLARLLLEPLSALGLRSLLILLFAKNKLGTEVKSISSLKKTYTQFIDDSMICGNDNIIKEVLKRRQTGRLCRSALIPITIITLNTSPLNDILTLILTYFLILTIYSFSEVTVFKEASRGHRILKPKIGDTTP